jgi:hypothetical protein
MGEIWVAGMLRVPPSPAYVLGNGARDLIPSTVSWQMSLSAPREVYVPAGSWVRSSLRQEP